MSHADVTQRIEALLERYQGRAERPGRREIDRLHTDGCAAVLALEASKVEVERKLAAVLTADDGEQYAARQARELALRARELDRELHQLQVLVRHLRTAADWTRMPESAQVAAIR